MKNHWAIQAYRHKWPLPTGGFQIDDFVEVTVTDAETEKEALIRAKEMIKRKYYRVIRVWKCEENHELKEDMAILQMKMQAKLLKHLG